MAAKQPEMIDLAPDVLTTGSGGVFVPNRGVALETGPWDQRVIRFPTLKIWYADGEMARPLEAWRHWHQVVNFRPLDALRRFIAIENPEGALEFARNYGPLWLCAEHEHCYWSGINVGNYRVAHSWQNPEPVARWLDTAQRMRTIYEVHRRLADRKGIRPDDLEAMGLQCRSETPRKGIEALALQTDARNKELHLEITEYCLALAVNSELQCLGTTVLLDRTLAPVLHGPPGFAEVLWRQLATVISGSNHMWTCSGCHTVFTTMRKLRAGKPHLCATCSNNGVKQKLWRRHRTN